MPKIDQDATHYIWDKGVNLGLSAHFKSSEFACHCTKCGVQKVSKVLVDHLEQVRVEFGTPIQINSGYRCSEYQDELRRQGYETAKGISTHQMGQAADIRPVDLHQMNDLLTVVKKHFMAIGVARSFLHVDERRDKERRWAYGKV